jgi:FkbM family methyltransferase
MDTERIMQEEGVQANALTSPGWNDPVAMKAACASAGETLAGTGKAAAAPTPREESNSQSRTVLSRRAADFMNRTCIAATRAMPANWLGLRLAMLFRKPVMKTIGNEGIDTELWGLRLRLYPVGNGCEKGALFTPQMYDVIERAALARAVAAAPTPDFTFIDIGANAGLYSFYTAAITGDRACIIAIEPQPEMIRRMKHNIAVNALHSIRIFPVALAEAEGGVELGLNFKDRGGAGLLDRRPAADCVRVPARTLKAIIAEAGLSRIDVLKIDVEGAEDEALMPFLADAPASLLPRLIVIEDSSSEWKHDLFGRLAEIGYAETGRSKHNRILTRVQ